MFQGLNSIPPTLSAGQASGNCNLAFVDDPTDPPADRVAGRLDDLPVRAPSVDHDFAPLATPVGVRMAYRTFSPRPKVIDDFSGSRVMAMVRELQKLRNLDGPDDFAGAVPAAFAKADQPYIEIGLLSGLFLLVAISAWGSVKAARNAYRQEYPAQVASGLAQQAAMIALLRDHGESPESLELLAGIHEEALQRHRQRAALRERGWASLLRHNIGNRWHRVPGNGALARAFNDELADIVAQRMARSRVVATVEVCYQVQLLERLEREREAAKRARTTALLGSTGISGMTLGMVTSESSAVCDAIQNANGAAGAGAAGAALATTTAAVMSASQVLQGSAGVLGAHGHRRDRQQIRRDVRAVRDMGEQLDDATHAVYAGTAAFHGRNRGVGLVCDALLSTGQGLMLGSNIAHFFGCPPAALAMVVPGATLTILASVGASLDGDHRARFEGGELAGAVRKRLHIGNLGERLKSAGFDRVTQAAAEGLKYHQRQAVQTRMWNDVLATLAREDVLASTPAEVGLRRHARLCGMNHRRRGAAHLMPAGMQALVELRQRRYPAGFFERPLLQIHEQLSREMWDHPARSSIVASPRFQKAVLFAALEDLARRRHPESRRLFHAPDGRLWNRIDADAEFFAHLARSPVALAVYQQRFNERLALELTPVDRFGRHQHQAALTDLAQTRLKRRALADAAGLDIDLETSTTAV